MTLPFLIISGISDNLILFTPLTILPLYALHNSLNNSQNMLKYPYSANYVLCISSEAVSFISSYL